MIKRQRLLFSSSAGLCLLAVSLATPSVSFAESTANWQSTVSSLLESLDNAQKTYSSVSGSVAEMPVSGLAERQKAATALELIRANVLEASRSGKVPQDLVQNTLTAINEAQTALTTESAQTIAWSLATVGQEVKAIDASFTGQPQPEGALQERPTVASGGTKSPERSPLAAAPEDQSARTVAEQRTGVVPNTPQLPNATTENRIAEARTDAPMQQAKPEQPLPQVVPTQQPAESAPKPAQSALADMTQSDVVGKTLYDRNGDSVASIQGVRLGPDGKIEFVEIDSGGFLGIGARRIAVPVNQLHAQGNRIEAALTTSEIQNLPQEYK